MSTQAYRAGKSTAGLVFDLYSQPEDQKIAGRRLLGHYAGQDRIDAQMGFSVEIRRLRRQQDPPRIYTIKDSRPAIRPLLDRYHAIQQLERDKASQK